MKQSQRIVIICQNEGFMETALKNNLDKEGFITSLMRPEITTISEMEVMPSVFLVYLDFEFEDSDFGAVLVYLRDRMAEIPGEFLLYLAGAPDELNMAEKYISVDKYVSSTFIRPLNVKELVERIAKDKEDNKLADTKKHILVVDDDPGMLNSLNSWLSDKYQIYMANSGMSALSLLVRHSIDLILLDYEMPVISGKTVLEMIRSEPETNSIPVMFLTAKSDRDHVMNVANLKPVKYLLKNLSPSELIAEIDDFFETQKSKDF
ncbi:MAG: response regulator [Eubacterium sp.]|nr:response regulator [Eubacterium sp.]